MHKNLISEIGYKKIVSEFKNLIEIEKPHWVKEKKTASEHGDRSENAEYISAKEMLRNIDKRLRFLEKIINNSNVIDTSKLSHDKVNFGSKVTLLDFDNEEEKTYSILGTYETNPNKNIISNISPLGKTLLGKSFQEEFEFNINNQTIEYKILKIELFEF